MNTVSKPPDSNNVETYIASFPEAVQVHLKKFKALITELAPEALEHFAYGMPAYKLKGKPLVYFAAQKNHIGFYATPSGHEAFAAELSEYKQGKGSVQFPLNKPIPWELISRMIAFRVKENLSLP